MLLLRMSFAVNPCKGTEREGLFFASLVRLRIALPCQEWTIRDAALAHPFKLSKLLIPYFQECLTASGAFLKND
jgi:hypothetical protein